MDSRARPYAGVIIGRCTDETAVRVGEQDQGGAAGFGALYRTHHRDVYHVALRFSGGDEAFAEDVTHDAFLKLMEALDGLDTERDVGAWLYRVAANLCVSRWRRERVRRAAPVRWLLGNLGRTPPTPETLVGCRAELRRAMETVAQLPAKERLVFTMRHLDGRKQVEIGRLLGHSPGYVSKLLARAEQKVRRAGWRIGDEELP